MFHTPHTTISISKIIMKKYWEKLLKNNLLPDPSKFSKDKLYRREHSNQFITPKNLILTIKTKGKNYNLGGPIYSAVVNLYDEKIIVTFVPPKFSGKQFYEIKWDRIISLNLCFLKNDNI